jgi:hypothetical protein
VPNADRTGLTFPLLPRVCPWACAACFILLTGAGAALAAADDPPPPAVQPDAVIEEWHQHWTLNADGSSTYHERKHVKLLNDRAYGEFADPRITFDAAADTVEVIHARVRTPAGALVDTPGYSRNEVAPSGPAGWPAFASLRQLVLTLSGIEPGCVTEVEYKVHSASGRYPVIAADLRLDHRYPTALRSVRVDTPVDVAVSSTVTNLADKDYVYTATSGTTAGRGTLAHRWEFIGLGPAIDEPHAPPWQARSPRLCFTTADPETWMADRLDRMQAAAVATSDLAAAARKWSDEEAGEDGRLRAIQRHLADTMHFVEFDPALRPAALRTAEQVFASSYALPEEAAAVLIALCTAAGFEARAGILLADEEWLPAAPHSSAEAACVAVVLAAGGPQVWHAQHGRIERDARWAGKTLHWRLDEDTLQSAALGRFTEPSESQLRLDVRIQLSGDGTYTGTAAFTATGLFMPAALAGDDARQKDRLRGWLGRLLPKIKVESLRVRTLTPGKLVAAGPGPAAFAAGEFVGEATLASDGPLEKSAGCFQLTLAADGPHTLDVAWPPLMRSRRQTPVRLVGPFEEQFTLRVEWPAGWQLSARPADGVAATAEWGSASQRVHVDGESLTLRRGLTIRDAQFDAAAFLNIREVLSQLRVEGGRTILLKP